ncbi:hypothetical protein A0H81_14576 [Grifola frondosa]|uniref:MARVEL domain-containing protein n=1 Tax=Grifola frondosa TaxID=5627 RepID=A0A1C7LL37_GRIFR|nr:hypothetical protein A0H81_14576 [Grifola frondosa]
MKPAAIRLPLYISLWVFSVLLLCFSSVRLNYTTHLPKGDTLNAGIDFYDPIVAELLVCSILALGFGPFVFELIPLKVSIEHSRVELTALSILWLLWLIGSAVSSTIWPNLAFCSQFEACRILSAMMAFAWLGWLAICGLLVLCIIPLVRKPPPPSSGPQTAEWAASSTFALPMQV